MIRALVTLAAAAFVAGTAHAQDTTRASKGRQDSTVTQQSAGAIEKAGQTTGRALDKAAAATAAEAKRTVKHAKKAYHKTAPKVSKSLKDFQESLRPPPDTAKPKDVQTKRVKPDTVRTTVRTP